LEELKLDQVYLGDCLERMKEWPDHCFDHCITDPPFNMSKKNGLGWAFSSHVTMQEVWDRFSEDEFFRFNTEWLSEVCRLVKPNGSILVFGTYHNIYQIGFILQDMLKRHILNSITWFKPNAQPNITGRTLTESTEQIIWAINETSDKAKAWEFNYWKAKELADDKQMRNRWFPPEDAMEVVVPVVSPKERKFGRHPTQKPIALIDRLVVIATRTGDSILDPFAGTGTVALSALRYRRRYVLIEKSPEYVSVANNRIAELMNTARVKILASRDGGVGEFSDDELAILTEVPVPQADHLDLVCEVPSYVLGGANTRRKISDRLQYADQLKYVGRQGPYYADAAMALGLVRPAGSKGNTGQRLEVTELGAEILKVSKTQLAALKRHIVLNSPILKYIAAQLGIEITDTANDETPNHLLLHEAKIAEALEGLGLSRITAQRRTTTLCSWLKQLTQLTLSV